MERLLQHEQSIPDKVIYILLEDGVNEKESITFAGMVSKAKAIAATLLQSGKKGDRVLLLFPIGLEFITSFFGCLMAGMIAVPAYPPHKRKANKRFLSILEDCEPAVIMATRNILVDLNYLESKESIESCRLLDYSEIDFDLAADWQKPVIDGDDIALLQYTSGSTGHPKGVMVSHSNIIHNSECIKQSFGFDENLIGVNWLPNFHDMGLIGCLIQPAYIGGMNVIIPPLKFIQNPRNWLTSITKYKATNAGGPNFAYDYCSEKIADEDLSGLDLSSLTTMFNGSEAVREESLNRFQRKFSKSGFSAEQYFPCYGMAETVLIVSGGDYKAEPVHLRLDTRSLEDNKIMPVPEGKDTRVLTACGYSWLGMSVIIVNPDTKTHTPADEIGEIWVMGPSVTRGYWEDEEKTEKTFNAYIDGTDDGPWLRTGDLGFIHEGQLYVSGRLKDLIIIRGSNFFPDDIERSLENCHEAMRQNASAAFSADIEGEEKLILVAEVGRTHMRDLAENEVFESIRNAVFAEHGIQPHAVTLIRQGSTMKTSSGKTQRFAMKNAWANDDLNIIASWEMKPDKEAIASAISFRPEFMREWMINWIAQKLEIDPASINPDRAVSAYGLDSITAVSLERDVNKQFGIEWPIESFLKNNSVNQLVEEGIELLRNK